MKRPLNYCIVWSEDGQRKEEITFSKASTVVRYIELMREAFALKISGLSVYAIYTDSKKDITAELNKFLYM